MSGAAENVMAVVAEQAADDGLWFEAETATEAYLRQELRRLHAAIEGKTPDQCARDFLLSTAPLKPQRRGRTGQKGRQTMTIEQLQEQNERLKELLRLALACEDNEAGWREDAKAELAK